MDPTRTDIRYRDLEKRLDWTEEDVRALCALAPRFQALPSRLIDEILRALDPRPQPGGGEAGNPSPLDSLREGFELWMERVFSGPYDRDYVNHLWEVGAHQAELRLVDRRIATLLLLRLRSALVTSLVGGAADDRLRGLEALQKRLDLDEAVIHDGYAAAAERDPLRRERMATLQQVMGGLAHELRQPLNAIRSSAYFLEHAEVLPEEKTAEHLQRIGRQVEFADQILRALSTLTSLRSPVAAPFCLDESVEEALQRNPVSPGVEVSIVDLESAPPVLADPGQIQIVLGNLLRNAREAMAGRGRLAIHARWVGEKVEIAVSDTGGGIAAEDLPRVFEPVFTTKPRGQGLGLAISRLILETLGGDIRVESELGRGTTFTLSLPAASSSPEPAAPEKGALGDPE